MNPTRFQSSSLGKTLLALGVCTLVSCGGPESSTTTIEVTSASPIAHKLASLEVGTGRTITAESARAFDRVLGALEHQCHQTRTDISDMTVVGVKQLRAAGKQVKYLEFLRAMNQIIPRGEKMDCRVVAATVLTLMEKDT